jgi:hypothetical protein
MFQSISQKTQKVVFQVATLALAGFLTGQYETPKKKPQALKDFVWPEGKKAALSLTFDDARLSQIDTGMPIFAKYKVRATFYVSPDNLEQRVDGWKQAVQDGHEIGNHTMTHPCTGNYAFSKENALEDLTLEKMAREIDGANELISKFLGIKPVSFAYPCCQTFVGRGKDVKSYVPLVAERFLFGRLGLSEAANDPTVCDPVQLLCTGSDGLSFDELKALVDQAVEDRRWLILGGHEIGPGGYQTTLAPALEKLCQYAQNPQTGIWIDTVGSIGQYLLKVRKK